MELANNKIRSMDGLQGHKYLELIDLEENEVILCVQLFVLLSNMDVHMSICVSR